VLPIPVPNNPGDRCSVISNPAFRISARFPSSSFIKPISEQDRRLKEARIAASQASAARSGAGPTLGERRAAAEIRTGRTETGDELDEEFRVAMAKELGLPVTEKEVGPSIGASPGGLFGGLTNLFSVKPGGKEFEFGQLPNTPQIEIPADTGGVGPQFLGQDRLAAQNAQQAGFGQAPQRGLGQGTGQGTGQGLGLTEEGFGPPYQVDDVIPINGKRFRVIGGDPNDPDVEEI